MKTLLIVMLLASPLQASEGILVGGKLDFIDIEPKSATTRITGYVRDGYSGAGIEGAVIDCPQSWAVSAMGGPYIMTVFPWCNSMLMTASHVDYYPQMASAYNWTCYDEFVFVDFDLIPQDEAGKCVCSAQSKNGTDCYLDGDCDTCALQGYCSMDDDGQDELCLSSEMLCCWEYWYSSTKNIPKHTPGTIGEFPVGSDLSVPENIKEE